MKILSLAEMNVVAGGNGSIDLEGYNFSFIVSNSLSVGVIGYLFFGVNFLTGATAGGLYALSMMGAKYADKYFDIEDSKPIINPVNSINTTAAQAN
ncbi:MAG: hypothetical protein JSS07_10490 [Proteobacteria bacterium]|nr:hypothetical protein [Pseudomonadota bacterium]